MKSVPLQFKFFFCFGITLCCSMPVGVLAAAAEKPAATPRQRTITIHAQVPEGVGTVYLPGNRPELGPWDPQKFALSGTGRTRTAVLHVPDGTELEFKFTLGSWEREGLGPSGTILPNHRLLADADKEVTIDIPDFKKETTAYFDTWKDAGVLGRLIYWTNVPSQHLAVTRHVEIWLPPGYDENPQARYPVLYMHDGQNLFDPRIANTGVDWGMDEAIVRGVKAGRIPPVIVVGVWCTGLRGREYSPWDQGPAYAKFLIEELMPKVNQQFRTLTNAQNTATMGSSLGGLISFWLCWKHPEAFGKGGCISTHFPYSAATLAYLRGETPSPSAQNETPLIERDIAAGATFPRSVRLYLDYGTEGVDAPYESVTAKVADWLSAQGLKRGEDFVVKKFPGATHNEAAWRARMDEPLTFLFGNDARASRSH
ncbi:MAG: hypothetical protein EPO07_17490 [Verrucomicrobia bacterium]|nr:MAG: hypothetical protein EPO07_17490 [Verrucomicrobiota bacterium]